ncbi:MAG TPA: hypothetical protein VFD11_05235 [Thiopseudomonas sp.]|nr:hypothetical protein [Thiopseudomonas sp.]
MQRQTSSAAFSSRFKRLFNKLMHGSRTYTPKQIAQRIELPFSGFNAPQLTVSWENNLNFQHLYKLPRHALSGAVQDDKTQAHTILNHLIKKETDTQSIIDLRHYHMPIMPEQAWDDPEFMTTLVETGSPYVRLTLSPSPQPIEVLLLPKHKQLSNTLGTALKLAGAQ